jgi:transcriptional regulator with XRE-family HTH domain
MARLRRAKGWSQPELGKRIGCNGGQISKLERGISAPRPDLLSRIAEALGTTADYLLTGREPGTGRDSRFRDLLPALESLPAEQRDNLVDVLNTLVNAQRVISRYQRSRARSRVSR